MSCENEDERERSSHSKKHSGTRADRPTRAPAPNETERNRTKPVGGLGERATLASASGARRSGARPVASRVTRVRTSRKNCLAFALASGSDAENTGAPAGALRPWLVASRETVARSAMFLPARHGRLPRDRQSCARPWSGGLRDCDVRCRADDTNPSPNPRARTVRRGEGRCPRRVRDREGKNENRPGIGIQSERADSLNPLRAHSRERLHTNCRSAACRSASAIKNGGDPISSRFITGTSRRARPRRNARSPVARRLRVERDEPGLGERPAAGA